MTAGWRHLPSVPRAIAVAADLALTAARSEDLAAFQRASERLAALDREQVGHVLGAVVRTLLEDRYPGGLTGEDVHDVLTRCSVASTAWFPDVDANVLLVLLAGSLGIHPEEEDRRPVSAQEMSSHAPLLISTLLGGPAGRPFQVHLGAALREIARSETVEMP